MGASVSAGTDNDELVDNLLEADYIKTATVERVFRAVDRRHYFTVECKDYAYKDLAWKYGNLHISAPCVYGEVMESLKLAPGMSFLNLGSGTGYLSTMAGLILGSYGINHGIELHEDVVNYAEEKLEEFCSTSPALDEYEFCKPKFINGNCLNLGSDARQYDRVYCGAACPENQENYMKNLIKVGGILVMPINEQLLQINRVSETNWEAKCVLPVSFARLACSNVPTVAEPLKMPDSDPLSLQDICRFAVRSILRRKIDIEHPELKRTPSRVPRKRVKKRTLKKFLIPVFSTHLDSDDNEAQLDEFNRITDPRHKQFLTDLYSRRLCRTVLDAHHLFPMSPRRSADLDDDEGDEREEEEGGDEKEASPSDFEVDKTKSEELMRSEIEIGNDGIGQTISVVSQRNKAKREKFDSGIVEDMEVGRGGSSDSENEADDGNRKNSRASENLFGKFEDSDTETGMSETSSSRVEEEMGNDDGEKAKNYSSYMREKIKLLPLPMTLKYFVNLDREL